MDIEAIAHNAATLAKMQVLTYNEKFFTSQRMYHTFADKTIVPTFLSTKISRSQTDVREQFVDVRGNRFSIFPVFGASMSYMRSRVASDIRSFGDGIHILPRVGLTELQRLQDIRDADAWVGVSLGVSDSDQFIEQVLNHENVKLVSIDVAHGASVHALEVLSKIQEQGVNSGVIVGNVGSTLGFLFVYNAMKMMSFTDPIIKVGVGPGSVCTTRINTGVGLGQLTLLEEIFDLCEYAIQNERLKYISDGGINNPGDFVKALSRSNGVMMAKFLASESFEEDIWTEEGVNLYGMASNRVSGKTNYVEGGSQILKPQFQYLGQATTALREGLQSAMTYVGATNLHDFRTNVMLALNSPGSYMESGVH